MLQFGDTVNTASRMESHGLPCRVHISQATHDAIVDRSRFIIEDRGLIEVKGRGMMHTYLVAGAHRSSIDSEAHSIRLPDMSHLQSQASQASSSHRRYGRRSVVIEMEALPRDFSSKDLGKVMEDEVCDSPLAESPFSKEEIAFGSFSQKLQKLASAGKVRKSIQSVFAAVISADRESIGQNDSGRIFSMGTQI